MGTRPKEIALLTVESDLHGILVQNALRQHPGIRCHLVPVDRICDHLTIGWSNYEPFVASSAISSSDGNRVKPCDLDLVWWRRSNPPQIVPLEVTDPHHLSLIRNDCFATLLGLFSNEFSGKWINGIDATRWAENKLVQLRAARVAGFRTPRSLVSNEPETIRAFCRSLDHRVVVKAVRGTAGRHLFTRDLVEQHLESDESLRLSPAIYQERIPGDLHLRVHCLGEVCHTVAITSEILDWREDLNVPFEVTTLNSEVEVKIRAALRLLGLRMGIVDMKITPEGTAVWLEINPQGQFLFAEALSGLKLTDEIAAFLAREAMAT